jgi:predicted RNase H-like nuclease
LEVYIGVDLAWGEKNASGFCVLTPLANKLKILDIKLVYSIDEIIDEVKKYSQTKTYIGIDAPLIIPNEIGNREIEKEFNKDFSKYKISMLPINRTILRKFSPIIRSEVLYQRLQKLGFKRDYNSQKVVFEVYPHATIAHCFNNQQILPYKKKRGRDIVFIKQQIQIYQSFLMSVSHENTFFKQDVNLLKGQSLKDYEDKLDAFTSAYTLFYCKNNPNKKYKLETIDTFITPVEER